MHTPISAKADHIRSRSWRWTISGSPFREQTTNLRSACIASWRGGALTESTPDQVESDHDLICLFEHDLRANAFRVCREGKPVSTLGSSPRACFSGSCSGRMRRAQAAAPHFSQGERLGGFRRAKGSLGVSAITGSRVPTAFVRAGNLHLDRPHVDQLPASWRELRKSRPAVRKLIGYLAQSDTTVGLMDRTSAFLRLGNDIDGKLNTLPRSKDGHWVDHPITVSGITHSFDHA
jgi:hypothetical protein